MSVGIPRQVFPSKNFIVSDLFETPSNCSLDCGPFGVDKCFEAFDAFFFSYLLIKKEGEEKHSETLVAPNGPQP